MNANAAIPEAAIQAIRGTHGLTLDQIVRHADDQPDVLDICRANSINGEAMHGVQNNFLIGDSERSDRML